MSKTSGPRGFSAMCASIPRAILPTLKPWCPLEHLPINPLPALALACALLATSACSDDAALTSAPDGLSGDLLVSDGRTDLRLQLYAGPMEDHQFLLERGDAALTLPWPGSVVYAVDRFTVHPTRLCDADVWDVVVDIPAPDTADLPGETLVRVVLDVTHLRALGEPSFATTDAPVDALIASGAVAASCGADSAVTFP